jgi:hypothetical protein
MECAIGYVWRGVSYETEYFGLKNLNFICIGFFDGALELNPVSPDGF